MRLQSTLLKGALILGILLFSTCEKANSDYKLALDQPDLLHRSMKKLTDVIVHDIFSPPVASRIYAYPSIAAYEILALENADYRSLVGQVHGLQRIPVPAQPEHTDPTIAAVHAFTTVGKALIFSEEKIEEFQEELLDEIRQANPPQAVIDVSLAYGEKVAAHILAWADLDNYKQSRTFTKYAIPDDPSRWQPTPPDYMDGIEPHWSSIRPFVLDSAGQFAPIPPTPFSTDENSLFWKETEEVYNILAENRDERLAVAEFWDCNPYVSHHTGHVMYATKKITPGGHWIGITTLACKKDSADIIQSAEAYALTSIALADAFISCWDEKYRSAVIRPETFINRYMDENWLPALQTPPFPEYTSGHSVISRAAAVVLTHLFGEGFSFEDTVEVEYGLPVRKFDSFLEASEEAAMSRLYGGIHYRPAVENGVEQGEKIGKFIVKELVLGKD